MTAPKKIKVTLVKGLRGTLQEHRASVRGLGLQRTNTPWSWPTRRPSAG